MTPELSRTADLGWAGVRECAPEPSRSAANTEGNRVADMPDDPSDDLASQLALRGWPSTNSQTHRMAVQRRSPRSLRESEIAFRRIRRLRQLSVHA